MSKLNELVQSVGWLQTIGSNWLVTPVTVVSSVSIMICALLALTKVYEELARCWSLPSSARIVQWFRKTLILLTISPHMSKTEPRWLTIIELYYLVSLIPLFGIWSILLMTHSILPTGVALEHRIIGFHSPDWRGS